MADEDRASYNLQIRLNKHEATAYSRAATKRGLELVQWVRSVCTVAAANELEVAIEKLVPREPPKMVITRNPSAAKKYDTSETRVTKKGRS